MAISINYTFIDGKGETSRTQINLPTGTTIVDISAFAIALAPLIDAVITGRITGIGACFDIGLPGGLTSAADVNSDVEEGAQFGYEVVGGFYTSMRIPTFNESKIIAGTREVNMADADVLALVTALTNGIDTTSGGGSGVISPCDPREADITALSYAREMFQNSRKTKR